jgi:hypothetical protein
VTFLSESGELTDSDTFLATQTLIRQLTDKSETHVTGNATLLIAIVGAVVGIGVIVAILIAIRLISRHRETSIAPQPETETVTVTFQDEIEMQEQLECENPLLSDELSFDDSLGLSME